MSSDVRLALHPFREYRARATSPSTPRALVLRVGRLLLVLGVFVSVTTAGRFVPFHIVAAPLAWSFAWIAQAIAIVVTSRLVVGRVALVRLLDLYFSGHAPWLFFAWIVSAACLLPISGQTLAHLLLATLPTAIAVTSLWGVVTTAALFRSGLGMTRGRTAVATLLFYVVYAAQIVGWFSATDQLVGVLPAKGGV